MEYPPRVFLSYRREDRAIARLWQVCLADRGIAFWRDAQSIAPAADWARSIRLALGQSEAAVVLLGPLGLSDYQRQEAETALAAGLPVLPVLLPGYPHQHPPRVLRAIEYLDARDDDDDDDPADLVGRAAAGIRDAVIARRARMETRS